MDLHADKQQCYALFFPTSLPGPQMAASEGTLQLKPAATTAKRPTTETNTSQGTAPL